MYNTFKQLHTSDDRFIPQGTKAYLILRMPITYPQSKYSEKLMFHFWEVHFTYANELYSQREQDKTIHMQKCT
ncbi:hypothetical protein BVRB_8g192270 [Beta vulgaris subsp. vulgaris]|nr:hypothetical protein BVRB_8g192270 [Beta vulgaris subsp. vulgaris]